MRFILVALWTCLVALNANSLGKSYLECNNKNDDWCWSIENNSNRAVFFDCGEFATWISGNQRRTYQLSFSDLYGNKKEVLLPIKCLSDRSGPFQIVNPFSDLVQGPVHIEITDNWLAKTAFSSARIKQTKRFYLGFIITSRWF